MSITPVDATGRRAWLATVARTLLGVTIATIAVRLGWRWLQHGCPTARQACRSCVLLAQCGLPRAQGAKRNSAS